MHRVSFVPIRDSRTFATNVPDESGDGVRLRIDLPAVEVASEVRAKAVKIIEVAKNIVRVWSGK